MLATSLIKVFDQTFIDEQTRLLGGFDEPFYKAGPPHQIRFRADYPRSALHEVAHWCIAGIERRQQDDYGYWYAPDGRDAQQQVEFERVEVRPQSLEALFCQAIGLDFEPSLDNLNGEVLAATAFAEAIEKQMQAWQNTPALIPERGKRFIAALEQYPF